MSDTVESLVAFCGQDSRVCPLPAKWNQLWEILPDRKRVGLGWQPPPPLILAAWHDTPAMLKMLRLTEHIEWAAQHDALDTVARFLRALHETDWFHVGE
jgi:hypothetical protein